MKRRISVRQHDSSDCGAACLVSVAAHHGRCFSLARVRQLAATDREGTTLLGMTEAAGKLGFDARAVRAEPDALDRLPCPAVVHTVQSGGLHHYVVLYSVKKTSVRVMDPTDGRLHSLPRSEFLKIWSGILLLLAPATGLSDGNERISISARLWNLLCPHKKVLLQALAGAILYTIAGLATAVYVQILVDHVLTGGNRNLLNLLGVVMIVILTLKTAVGSLKNLFILKTGQLIDLRLLLDYYSHLLRLPHSFLDSMRSGEMISRMNDAVSIRNFINDTALQLTVNLFIILFSYSFLFAIHWKLALFLTLIIPVSLIIYLITNRLNRKTQRQMMERAADLESELVENLQGISTIRQLNLEESVERSAEGRLVRLLGSVYRSGVNAIFSASSSEWVSSIFTILTLWIGSSAVLDGELTIGELLSFYTVIGYFTGPVMELIGMNRSLQDALIASDRLFAILDLEPEKSGGNIPAESFTGPSITIQDLTFSYGYGTAVLNRLNLEIPGGTVTAFVGGSGSGKTTLFRLLQKLYPAEQGEIAIEGISIEMIETGSLRRTIGVVPQQVHLFSGSLLENIATGDPEPDARRAWRICRQIGMDDFIEALPSGFDTPLGADGARISGGQKQWIGIARAIYKAPSILLMDEATSSLDSASDRQIRTVLRDLAECGTTVLRIAHRLASVTDADRICLVSGGRILESGTHRDLLISRGDYYRLWQDQKGEGMV